MSLIVRAIDIIVIVLHAETNQRSSSTDSRIKGGSDVDVTSQGNPRDVITSSPMSSSMPHLGPDTIQPLNHIYRSSSAALAGCHGDVGDDDDAVSMTTRKVWTGRQGRQGVMTSRNDDVTGFRGGGTVPVLLAGVSQTVSLHWKQQQQVFIIIFNLFLK